MNVYSVTIHFGSVEDNSDFNWDQGKMLADGVSVPTPQMFFSLKRSYVLSR